MSEPYSGVRAFYALREKTHADLAIRALRAGCHILCEKPFAMDATEARAMLAAAESAGKVHVIGNEFRFAPQRAAAARAIADGMIGEPRLGTFVQLMNFVSHFEDSFPDWWFTEESGGGWLGASGSHLVDQVRSWLGEFETVCASMANVALQRGQVDDTFSVHFRMESGLEGVLQQSTSAFGPFTEVTQVTGSLGTVWTDSDGLHVGDRSGSRLLPIPDDLILPPAPDLGADERQARPDWKIMAETEIAPYTQLCRALRARILGEEAVSPITIATFADGLANMRVMDAIRRSAAQGGRLVRIADC